MKNILLLLVSLLWYQLVVSQCATRITTFPYTQTFELNNGGWSASGATNWQWGAIVSGTKQVITSAANGSKCWIVGGLNTSQYNSGVSYLQSPCFDFSTLTNPQIELNIIWETEANFDGANLQYSIDEGTTWNVLGTTTSNTNCQATNWYNNNSVRFIGYTNGWSGSVRGACQTGGGIGAWVYAQHNMRMLAGKSKVIFRFEFGAGTICNNYDGFAFDDFSITETPAITSTFAWNCVGNNSVKFTNNPTQCQTNIYWNFGDPNSGTNNTSTINIPTHTFSNAGTYIVTQTISYATGQTSIHTETISILKVTQTINNQILCYGNGNGSITANGIGTTAAYNYQWSTNQQTQTINNLQPGSYTVTINSQNSCPATSTIVIAQPTKLELTVNSTTATCDRNNGAIITNVTGGTLPYVYLWSNGANSNSITNLYTGTYSIIVKDKNDCTINSNDIIVGNNLAGCVDIYFPNSFTPNGDGLNDAFGPIGDLRNVFDYRLFIYNRYGKPVFISYNPIQKWNGKYLSKEVGMNTFVWIAKYKLNGEMINKKGTLIILK